MPLLGFWIKNSCAKFDDIGRTPCSTKGCAGPYRIGIPSVPKLKETLDEASGILYRANATIVGVMGKRQRYTSYCYDGGAIDPNTGCDRMYTSFSPGVNELLEWGKKEQCQRGIVCNKGDYECWGSGAARCTNNPRPFVEWVKESKMQNLNEPWMVWPHHSCILQWECWVHKATYQIHLGSDGNGGVIPVTYDQNGAPIVLNRESNTLYKVDENTNLLLMSKGLQVKSFDVKLTCFYGAENHSLCQLPTDLKDTPLSGTVMEFNNGVGFMRNLVVMLNKHPRLQGDKPVTSKNLVKNGKASREDIGSHILAAASIDDVKPVMSALLYANAESNYNIGNLLKEIRELRVAQAELIKSVGKVDDELIGNILEISSKTKWFNHDLFHMCPCYQVGLPEHENCKSGFMFKNGRLTTQYNTSECTTYSKEVVKDLGLYHARKFPLSTLELPPPLGISQDWDGWSFYSVMKEKLVQNTLFGDSINSPTSPLSYFLESSLDSVKGWSIFGNISSFVGWIALCISIIALCRR